jgi:hypothetical protein
VLYAAFSIQTQALSSATEVAQSQQQLDRIAYVQRLSALASDTKDERATLESLVQPDVVSIVNTIEAAGQSAHISATVSDALPEGPLQQLPGGESLQAVAFVVQAHGTFPEMMKLGALFEKLPLASSVEQFDLEHTSAGDQTVSWSLTARIRVMTTSVSSS